MSYILDALKKSEQERQRGAVPNLHTVQAPVTGVREHRSRWPLVVALALLLNAGLLVWWLYPWQPTSSKSVTQPGIAQQPAENRAGAARDPAHARRGASSGVLDALPQSKAKTEAAQRKPASGARPPASDAATQTSEYMGDNQKDPAEAAAVSRASNRAAPKPDTKAKRDTAPGAARKDRLMLRSAVEPTKKAGSAAPPADARPDPARWQGPDRQHEAPAAPAPPSEAREALPGTETAVKPNDTLVKPVTTDRQVSPSARVPAEQKLPELRELPPAIRKDLPDLFFSMVVHSPRPADRMISINGRMMREGQEISPGLKLEEITPNGAVFTFQGRRFRKGVF
jgi:general secretion pathway protein B